MRSQRFSGFALSSTTSPDGTQGTNTLTFAQPLRGRKVVIELDDYNLADLLTTLRKMAAQRIICVQLVNDNHIAMLKESRLGN